MQEIQEQPVSTAGTGRLLTGTVREATDRLLDALEQAVQESEFYRDEAQGRLSAYVCMIWDDIDARIVKPLPQQPQGSKNKFELQPSRIKRGTSGRPTKEQRRAALRESL